MADKREDHGELSPRTHSTPLLVFGIEFQCLGRSVSPHHPTISSLTSARCPSVQLNSEAIYLEIASDSTGPTALQDCSPFRCQSQAQVALPDYKSEVPMTPSLGLINLVAYRTWETHVLTRLPAYYKGFTWGLWINSQAKRCIGEGMGKGLHTSSLPHLLQAHHSNYMVGSPGNQSPRSTSYSLGLSLNLPSSRRLILLPWLEWSEVLPSV